MVQPLDWVQVRCAAAWTAMGFMAFPMKYIILDTMKGAAAMSAGSFAAKSE